VAERYLEARREFLLRTQNADGGWGYFAGKQSWMEPTAYATLALLKSSGSQAAVERAWRQMQTWQTPDGGWRPGGGVQDPTWVTSLGLIAGASLGIGQAARQRSVEWLLKLSGRESRWTVRVASYLHMLKTDVNVNHEGWPWWPGNSAWIEPTAMGILALKKSTGPKPDHAVAARVKDGEELILSRRGRDGGWNSGNPSVLKVDIPSYPETTAIALIGLQGRSPQELAGPLASAGGFYGETKSSLAKAWLTIAFRCHGVSAADPDGSGAPSDVLLCALQALGHPAGNHRLLRPEASS
jgi:hypothetical protein